MKDKTQYDFKPCESDVKKPKKYMRLTSNMMESKAWESLDCYSIVAYVHIKIKYNFTNEDNISFTYKEGMKLMNKKTFTKSMDKLIETGFIYIVRQGVLKECSIYGLSKEWQNYGKAIFRVTPRTKRANNSKGDI